MNPRQPCRYSLGLFWFSILANLAIAAATLAADSSSYSIREIGLDYRIVERVNTTAARFSSEGSTTSHTRLERTNSYTELATGLYRLDENNELVESSPQIELIGTNGVAQQTRHRIIFGPNINKRHHANQSNQYYFRCSSCSDFGSEWA